MAKRLFLIDASGYIFRAYYAIRPLSNAKGLPTNALYGFTAMLLKLLREQKPEMVGVVFDVARKTFRNEKYPEYKANRSEPPPDLVPQFPYFRKITQALNLPVLELPNYEADDVIGTIAKKFEKEGWETVIVTGDKDLMQLVDEKISLYDPMKEREIRNAEVVEKFGVGPKQVTDILGLSGDSSDNIPGVPGIGDKTATKLILEYGSVENLLSKAGEVKGRLGEKLREFGDQARLCKDLATIVTDAPIAYDIETFHRAEPDKAAVKELFEELGFKALMKELGVESDAPTPSPKAKPQANFEIDFSAPAATSGPVSSVQAHAKELIIGNYLLDPDKRSQPVEDFEELKKRLAVEGLMPLFFDIEWPLVAVLEKIQANGVKIDSDQLRRSSVEYGERLQVIEKAVHEAAGSVFNLNSPKQLGAVLFEQLKLPVIRKTKTGYSTDVDVLTELAPHHAVPKLLLEYRTLSKLKSTYLDALVGLISPETGRLHTSFQQTVAATGRLSSTNPNLQNIPIRSEEGRKIRKAFIAEKGNLIVSADYSQIELRLLAHFTKDATLVKAFEEDKDIHSATAAGIFGVPEDQVSTEQRAMGKTVNFGVLYGQGAFGLSQQLGITIAEAEKIIQNYYAQFASVAAYKEVVLNEVRRTGWIKTLFGRLRRFPEIQSPKANLRSMWERTAFNMVFQGTAADIIKIAMIRIQNRIEKEFPKAMMILQVHDELLFECPENLIEDFSKMVKSEMEGAASLNVPLRVDVGKGSTWAEAH